MKIRNVEIQNFKNHKNTVITNCSDFHLLYGGSATGKTNFIRVFNEIKNLRRKIDNFDESLCQISPNSDKKKTRILLSVEVQEKERRLYLKKFFNFSNQLINKIPRFLKWIFFEFSILPLNNSTNENDNRLFLTRMDISGSKSGLVPIFWKLEDNNQNINFKLKIIKKTVNITHQKRKLNGPQKITDISQEQQISLLQFLNLNSDYFQVEIINKFINIISIFSTGVTNRSSSKNYHNRFKKIHTTLTSLYLDNKPFYDEINNEYDSLDLEVIYSTYPNIALRNFDLIKYINLLKNRVINQKIDQDHRIEKLLALFEIGILKNSRIWFLDELIESHHKLLRDNICRFLGYQSNHGKQIFLTSRVQDILSYYKFQDITILKDQYQETKGKVNMSSAEIVNPYLKYNLETNIDKIIDYVPKIYSGNLQDEQKQNRNFSEKFIKTTRLIIDILLANMPHDSIRLKKEIERILHETGFIVRDNHREQLIGYVIESYEHFKRDKNIIDFRNRINLNPNTNYVDNGFINLKENEQIEFKSSFRYDYQLQKINKKREKDIAKSVAGFANSKGGELFIGVSDEGKILGLENDYFSLKKKNSDGFEIEVRQSLVKYTKIKMVEELLNFEFPVLEEKEICRITISRGEKPVIVYDLENERIYDYYVRHGNSTKPYNPNEFQEYWQRRNTY